MTKAISKETIKQIIYSIDKNKLNIDKDQFGYYLTGLFEGDGHLSLPFLGKTILNRVLNPRIVFISHINNIKLYVYIQSMLGGKGRFQIVNNNNTIRYIIGDIEGIKLFINLVHGKFRTPKNESLNRLIDFINKKYNLTILFSNLDKSDLSTNSWFTGFTEADGHFGIKIIEAKPKPDTQKRSVCTNISLKFRLDQRYFDQSNSMSMLSIMENLAEFLLCVLSIYKIKTGKVLSLNVSSIDKIKLLVQYYNKYPLLGIKGEEFRYWETVYSMMVSKQHLTEEGRSIIRLIQYNMNSKRKVNLSFTI
jgi:hypothetical protein